MARKTKKIKYDGNLLPPKNDFVFKLLFGNEKHKELLKAFLNAVIKMPEDELEEIELINTELLREFAEDRKGILDVRAKTKRGINIDIEIQVLYTEYMPERTVYYWSKMYTGQIKSGDTYDKLEKCITINILDFKFIPVNKLHTTFHIIEDETGEKLTDILEIHFLELPKLFDDNIVKDEKDPVVDWMTFIDGKSKGVLEMLAEKNPNIKKAYDVLQIISQDEKARMAYEAREAELHDQMTRLKSAREEGREEGKLEIILNMLKKGMDVVIISEITGLPTEKIMEIKKRTVS